MDKKNVINFKEAKQKKENEQGEENHQNGEGFRFDIFEFDEDPDAPNGVGVVDDEEHPIIIFHNIEELTGICMSPETAKRLAKELLAVAKDWKSLQKVQ